MLRRWFQDYSRILFGYIPLDLQPVCSVNLYRYSYFCCPATPSQSHDIISNGDPGFAIPGAGFDGQPTPTGDNNSDWRDDAAAAYALTLNANIYCTGTILEGSGDDHVDFIGYQIPTANAVDPGALQHQGPPSCSAALFSSTTSAILVARVRCLFRLSAGGSARSGPKENTNATFQTSPRWSCWRSGWRALPTAGPPHPPIVRAVAAGAW